MMLAIAPGRCSRRTGRCGPGGVIAQYIEQEERGADDQDREAKEQ